MKKNLKSGFTLAEVLITLAIIGIIAAIIMPAVIANYQYKTVGVKLSKFASTVENAARAYVVSNDSFKSTASNVTPNGVKEATSFVNEALIFKSVLTNNNANANYKQDGLTGTVDNALSEIAMKGAASSSSSGSESDSTNQNATIGIMKDNTKVMLLPVTQETTNWTSTAAGQGTIKTDKVGEGSFVLVFDPAVTGLPKQVQKSFSFVVTELGYMYPAANDNCLWSIYNNDWTTNRDTFKKSGTNACINTSN